MVDIKSNSEILNTIISFVLHEILIDLTPISLSGVIKADMQNFVQKLRTDIDFEPNNRLDGVESSLDEIIEDFIGLYGLKRPY